MVLVVKEWFEEISESNKLCSKSMHAEDCNIALMVIMMNCFKLEAYLKPCQTSKMSSFAKIVNSWKLLFIFAKSSILDVWQVYECAPRCGCRGVFSTLSNINKWTFLVRWLMAFSRTLAKPRSVKSRSPVVPNIPQRYRELCSKQVLHIPEQVQCMLF